MSRSISIAATLMLGLLFTCVIVPGVNAGGRADVAAQDSDVPTEAEQSLFTKGQGLYNKGHYDQAAGILRYMLKAYPKSIIRDITLLWLGRSYIQLGEIAEAEQVGQNLRTIKDTPFVDIYESELKTARKNIANKPATVALGTQTEVNNQNKSATGSAAVAPSNSISNSRSRIVSSDVNANQNKPPVEKAGLVLSRPRSSLELPKSANQAKNQAANSTTVAQVTKPGARQETHVVARSSPPPVAAVNRSLRPNANSHPMKQGSNLPGTTSVAGGTAPKPSSIAKGNPTSESVQSSAIVSGRQSNSGLNITVRQVADLTLSLKRASEVASPGQLVQLPVTVSNVGSSDDRFRLETDLPAEYQPAFNIARAADASELPILVTPPVPKGSSLEIVLSLRIPAAAQNGLRVPFNVRAYSEADSEVQKVSAGTINIVASTLTAVASISKSSIQPGDTLTQTILIQNSGGSVVGSSRADFVFSPNVEVLSTSPASTYDKVSRTAIWSLGDLNPGEQRQITVNLRASSDALAQSTEIGRGKVRSQSLPIQASFDGPKIEVLAVPKVRVDAVSVGLTARPGETVYFPFVIRNSGNVKDVYELGLVSDGAPGAIVYADLNGDGVHQANEPSINQTSRLAQGGGEYPVLVGVEIPVNTSDRQQYSYNLVARSISNGKVASEASSVLTVTMPRVSVRTEQITSAPAPGATIFYRLVVVNDGSSVAKNVTVTENLPEALQLVGTDPVLDQTDVSGGSRLTWRVSELGPGDTAVVRIGVKLRPNLRPDMNLTETHTLSYEDNKGRVYKP